MLRIMYVLVGVLLASNGWAQAVPGTLGWDHPRDAGLTSFKVIINGTTTDIGLPATNVYAASLTPGDTVIVTACYGATCYNSASFTVPGAPPPPPPPPPPPTGEMTHKGRWKDGGIARALPNWVPMPGHFSTWGPAVCAASARALGYGAGDFVGMQALQQCWAGKAGVDDPYRYGQPVPLGVSKTCRDGSGAFCGGDWVNDVFELH